MATITLNYNTRNIQAQRALDYILSTGFFTTATNKTHYKKSRVEQSLEEVENGKIFFLTGPKQI
ncbi:MAG: hypothetical protein FWF72_04285 [Paludibacter sp.]|nr:hypothetical protein [Paludibacter sp.]